MAAPTTTMDFVELLRKSGILSGGVLERYLPQLPAEPVKAAGYLVKQGLLTPFQAKLILGGRHRGFKLGPYIILDQLGQGGMGMVYQAEHETLRRKVAIKILTSTDSKNNITIERFQREARAAAALDHPNIVRIFDVSCLGETHYLVMEYIDGETLEQMGEKSGPMACGRAVELMLQACAGLQHAYEKGFVHRDIKPANLILSKDNTLKILDMGLARSFDNADKLTELLDQGSVVGTADFISPEQAMNSPGQDIRADIYSLGATFFSLVTGRPPFEGNTTQKLIQHQMKDPPTIASIDKTFPAGLSEVVAKMLKKKPDDRYQTPAEVMAALGPWLPSNSRVVATLSRTNLPQSAAQKAQLDDMVKSLTGQLPNTIEVVDKPDRKRSLFPVIVAAVVLGVVIVGGSLLAMSYFQKKTDNKLAVTPSTKSSEITPELSTSPTTQIVPTTQPTMKSQESPSKALTSVSKTTVPLLYPAGTLVYDLDLGEAKPIRELGTMENSKFVVKDKTGTGRLPTGWSVTSWKPEAFVECMISEVDGRNAISMATMSDTKSGMLFVNEIRFPGPSTKVIIEYKTPSATGFPMLRLRQTVPRTNGKDVYQFPNTKNEWKKVEVDLDTQDIRAGIFEFHSWNLPSEGSIMIRKFAVVSSKAPLQTPIVKLDLAKQEPFRNRYAQNPESLGLPLLVSISGSGKLPSGWTMLVDGSTSEPEVFAQGPSDAISIGFYKAKGPAAAQLCSPKFTTATGKVRVRMVYQISASIAPLRFRPSDGSPVQALSKLPASHLAWSSWEQEFDFEGATTGTLELVSPSSEE